MNPHLSKMISRSKPCLHLNAVALLFAMACIGDFGVRQFHSVHGFSLGIVPRVTKTAVVASSVSATKGSEFVSKDKSSSLASLASSGRRQPTAIFSKDDNDNEATDTPDPSMPPSAKNLHNTTCTTDPTKSDLNDRQLLSFVDNDFLETVRHHPIISFPVQVVQFLLLATLHVPMKIIMFLELTKEFPDMNPVCQLVRLVLFVTFIVPAQMGLFLMNLSFRWREW